MRFAEIIGHEELKRALRNSVGSGRIPHAQLFTGNMGCGALALALAYVQYINCTNRNATDSCGECASCRQIEQLAHPDLHIVMPVNKQGKKSGEAVMSATFIPRWRELMAATRGYLSPERWYEALDLGKTLKGAISAREADEVVKRLSFKSFSQGYKAMIIWLPEMMNEQAANKLLKILEEPWDRTLFILVSERPETLLSTIISRTQLTAIGQIEEWAMMQYAAQQGVAEEAQQRSYARLAAGNLLEMQRILGGGEDQQRRVMFDHFTSLMRLSYNDKHLELMGWAEEMAQLSRSEQLGFMKYSLALLRDAYIRHAGVGVLSETWGGEAEFCTKFAPFIGNHNIEPLVAQIELAVEQLTQNANPTILFTHFALTVSRMINKIV
ncbi:MAG: DNA polymerase III subunit delta [Rikenellaceae bacterium]